MVPKSIFAYNFLKKNQVFNKNRFNTSLIFVRNGLKTQICVNFRFNAEWA